MASTASSRAVAGGCSTSAITTATVSGSHVLTINGYSESRAYGVGSSIASSKFLVAGHSWFLRCYPVGWNEETSDRICFFLVHDGRSSVRAQLKFSLLDLEGNQVHSAKSFCPVAFHGYRCFWFCFIKREDFENSNYLRDNSFRVVYDITVINGFYKEGTMMFVDTVPPSDLHKDLGRLLASGKGVDVKLKVRDKLFLAHKNVLAARSSVFMAELFGPLKEGEADSVEIHDMEPVVFKAMLDFIYTDNVPEVRTGEEIAMAQHLLVAADRYDLKRLKMICEHNLCSRITKKTAATTLVLAEQHGCNGLKKACFAFLSSLGSLKAVMDTQGYDHLRSSCPSLHDELVAKFDVSKRNKIRSFLCFSVK
ncbi:BTB/POZ and MATH domain-containing protein 1 [Setaria viridis]|uniref:BTB/POZ and MATH domain-containing protein 1 n=1 Tax=Setaria viridis TaxID=4556 RepID=UPI0014937E8D|nr:BTB/POZ and MATH domain-containing protein 1-like [Setaria viridis]